MGEKDDFLSQENHLFINKLNYICKNYDTSFKDVSLSFPPRNHLLINTHYSLIGEKHETAIGGLSLANN